MEQKDVYIEEISNIFDELAAEVSALCKTYEKKLKELENNRKNN